MNKKFILLVFTLPPDEKIVPTALDLANNRDPVLSRAAKILGYQMTAEEAGQIFKKDK